MRKRAATRPTSRWGCFPGRESSARYPHNAFTTRLPALAGELVRRQVALIVAGGGTPAAVAVKVAAVTIPIVFAIATDPVKVGLVASLKRTWPIAVRMLLTQSGH